MKNTDLKKSENRHAADPVLQKILASWLNVQRKYARHVPEDLLCYYRERPCIGFLAAAAWQAGGVAMEEYETLKSAGKSWCYGRGDLWIRHSRKDFFVEARHTEVFLKAAPHSKRTLASVERCFKGAIKCAERQKIEKQSIPQERIAILFIGTTIESKKVEEQRIDWLKNVEQFPHSGIAWTFVQHGKKSVGIILLAKIV